MRNGLKKYWNELTAYVTKEQTFALTIYFTFTAYLKNNGIGTPINSENTGELSDLKQLREIFKKIPGYDLKVSANDFEESIGWEIFSRRPCEIIARNLKEEIEYAVKTEEDLERIIEEIKELKGEADNLMFTPSSVNELIARLAIEYRIHSIGDFYGGLGDTGLKICEYLNKTGRDASLTIEEQRKLYCDIARIRMFCHGFEKPEVIRKDLMKYQNKAEEHKEKKYDLIVADLPKRSNESIYVEKKDEIFGRQEKAFAEWVSVQGILDRLSDRGRAMIIVTKGALVRQREEKIRENITRLDWLEAVITLPQNIYAATHLGFEILILNKNKKQEYKNKVFFADLSECAVRKDGVRIIAGAAIDKLMKSYEEMTERENLTAIVSSSEIATYENSWNPFLYLKLKKVREKMGKTIELGEIAQITRGAQITHEEEKMLAEKPTHYWLNIRNIDWHGLVLEDASMLSAKSEDWEEKFQIMEDDIILTSKVTVMKACIVKPDPPPAFLCGNLTRIRVNKEKYSPYVLYEFLCSDEGRALLESIQTGTTIKVLNNKNLGKMNIPAYENVMSIGEKLKKAYLEYDFETKRIKSEYEKKKEAIEKQLRQ